jgi:hypothetical protein
MLSLAGKGDIAGVYYLALTCSSRRQIDSPAAPKDNAPSREG